MVTQTDLFGGGPALPEGFRYEEQFISREEQARLVDRIRSLPFEPFQFHGYEGKRRVISFGWRYDFDASTLEASEEIPAFLLDLRERVAGFADLPAAAFKQVLVTEYDSGAGIGWHRDKAVFREVAGVSLLSTCVFRLRRKAGAKWERASVVAAPGSAYLLSGPARTEWEHSIPAVDSLRYSVTYRTLAQ